MNIHLSSTRAWQLASVAFILASAMVAVAGYIQALDYPFVYDDVEYVADNPKLAGLHLVELWRLFVEPYNRFEFLPIRDLSYWFDMTLFGLTPSAFRVHNIVLYLLCLPLIYGTTLGVWRYFRPNDPASAPSAAAAVTALFALHPAHVEAVVWIAGRKDLLSAMFSLCALWFAIHAKRESGFCAFYAAAALAALLAAILSKATAVAVSPLIALLWIIFWQDIPASNRRYPLLLWPLGSLLLATCTTLIFVANSDVKATAYFGAEVIIRALAVLGWLARLVVSPENRHFYYQVFDDPYLPLMISIGVMVSAGAVFGMVMMLRKRSLEGFSLVAFFLLCAPYTQLIPFETISLVSDRFLTLALWPAALLIVALAWRINLMLRTALLLAVLLPWCFQSIARPLDWHSQETLIEADLLGNPGYYMPAREKVIDQLQHGLFLEAGETAHHISTPGIRNIMAKLVEAAHAVDEAKKIGDPHEAMLHLQDLGLLLKQRPVQSKWDPPLRHFWLHCEDAFAKNWKWLVMDFPDDVPLRDQYRLSMVGVHELRY